MTKESIGDPVRELAERRAHVITKIRTGGDRDGEVTSYLVGPVRGTREEAEEDLAAFLREGEREAGWAGQVAALRGALEGLRGAIRRYVGSIDLLSIPELKRAIRATDAALATDAGKAEAEVIRAAMRLAESDWWLVLDNDADVLQCGLCWHCHEDQRRLIQHAPDCPIGDFVAYLAAAAEETP